MSVVSLQIRKQFPCRTQVPLYTYRQTSGGAASNRHAIPSPPPLPQTVSSIHWWKDGERERISLPSHSSSMQLLSNKLGDRFASCWIFILAQKFYLPFSRERREGNSFTVLLFLSVDVKIYSYCLLLLSNDKLRKKLIKSAYITVSRAHTHTCAQKPEAGLSCNVKFIVWTSESRLHTPHAQYFLTNPRKKSMARIWILMNDHVWKSWWHHQLMVS